MTFVISIGGLVFLAILGLMVYQSFSRTKPKWADQLILAGSIIMTFIALAAKVPFTILIWGVMVVVYGKKLYDRGGIF